MSESRVAILLTGELLKLVCEDLWAYYFEPVAVQPERAHASSAEVREWFWKETASDGMFRPLQPICAASGESVMRAMAAYILVPRVELGGAGDNPEFSGEGAA